MIKEKLLEKIEDCIFSQDCIGYKTVRWGWCTDRHQIERFCQMFRDEGVSIIFDCDKGNAEYPSRNFRFDIENYNEGMIERANRVIRRIEKGEKK